MLPPNECVSDTICERVPYTPRYRPYLPEHHTLPTNSSCLLVQASPTWKDESWVRPLVCMISAAFCCGCVDYAFDAVLVQWEMATERFEHGLHLFVQETTVTAASMGTTGTVWSPACF